MNRLIILAALVLVPITLLVTVMANETRFPAVAQARLDQYVVYGHPSWSEATRVLAMARAREPWKFSRDMGYVAVGDSIYYQTDHGYNQQESSGARPLPFPPQEVWCVLLEQGHTVSTDSREEVTRAIVFVALHQDLYNADWVIHEGRAGLPLQQFMADASMIGCDLGTNQ